MNPHLEADRRDADVIPLRPEQAPHNRVRDQGVLTFLTPAEPPLLTPAASRALLTLLLDAEERRATRAAVVIERAAS